MKKQVHYADLEDMQKYIEGFNPNDYESCGGHTDPSVTEYVRNYYRRMVRRSRRKVNIKQGIRLYSSY